MKTRIAAIYSHGEPIKITSDARLQGDIILAQSEQSPIARKAAHVLMKVRNKELTFIKGQEALMSLSLDCETVKEVRYIEAAKDVILDYEKRFNAVLYFDS